MTNPEVSIIVPVYNVEKYLHQCLDSIQAQTFRNWECIVVDDGSTDSSASICDLYSHADSRFIVIHKENGGVSSARNAALEIARGEFIGFADPDDWCEPGMFGHLLHLIKTHDADIAQVGFMLEFAGIEPDKPAEPEVTVIDKKTAMMAIGSPRMRDYVWNKLHRRKVITCGFPTGRNFEDIYVYGRWLHNVERMVLDTTPLYHYRMRKGSIVHANTAKNICDYVRSYAERMDLFSEVMTTHCDRNRQIRAFTKAAVNASKTLVRYEKDRWQRREGIGMIREMLLKTPLPDKTSLSPKQWFRLMLLRDHPAVFALNIRVSYLFNFNVKRKMRNFYD